MTDDGQDSEAARTSLGAGKVAVLTMVGVAILAASFAWWWNFNRGRKSLEFYGPQAATLIRTAPRVEILRPAAEGDIDISQAPGLINARASLLSDASYDWSTAGAPQESPLFSVRFSRRDKSVVITFDFENRTITNSATPRIVTLKPKTADGWRAYLGRWTEAKRLDPAAPR